MQGRTAQTFVRFQRNPYSCKQALNVSDERFSLLQHLAASVPFFDLHFRPRACGGSRVLLAHTGCWAGGFCLLCRQASMARWARYYSRGSSTANLEDKEETER